MHHAEISGLRRSTSRQPARLGQRIVLVVVCILSFAAISLRQTVHSSDSPQSMAPDPEPLQVTVVNAVNFEPSAFEWNWGAWDQDKIISCGDYQYTVYWAADRSLAIGRRDLRNNQVQTVHLPQYKLTANDRHRNTCLGVSLADGRLHLSWDHHCDQLHYTRSRAGFLTDPPSTMTSEDFEAAQSMLGDPSLEKLVTYPRFFTDRNGELFSFYRIGKSGDGENYLQRYDAASGKWTRIGMVTSSRGTYGPWKNSTSRNAYFQDLLFDDNDRLHAIWTYREVSATWASNHDLHYAYSDDHGATWQNNAGEQIADLAKGDPIELSDPGLVVVDIPVNSWLMNAGPMAFDSQGRPHVVTFKASEVQPATPTQHDPEAKVRSKLVYVHYWRDDSGQFHGGESILPGANGTVRGDIVFDQDDNLFFYYPTSAGIEYYWSAAADHWSDFQGPFSLTDEAYTAPQRNSTKHDRVRWREDNILSFTVEPRGGGYSVLELKLEKKQ